MSNQLLEMYESLKTQSMDASNLMFGTVTSIAPLTIFADNRLHLSGNFLVLSKMCRRFAIKTAKHFHDYKGNTEVALDHVHQYNGDTSIELEEIELWRDLKVDDIVILLAFGQKFYVAERVEV